MRESTRRAAERVRGAWWLVALGLALAAGALACPSDWPVDDDDSAGDDDTAWDDDDSAG